MKTLANLIFLIAVSIVLLASCENEESSEKQSTLTAKLMSNSDCKSLKSANVTDYTSKSSSCIEYSFDSDNNLLTIQHINAGFNCCPESLYCEATLKKDTIIIQEFETSGLCDCNCLYDLEIELTGVDSGKYMVKFIEPYVGNNEKIIFEMDLTSNSTGTYCVTRDKYPWGYNR